MRKKERKKEKSRKEKQKKRKKMTYKFSKPPKKIISSLFIHCRKYRYNTCRHILLLKYLLHYFGITLLQEYFKLRGENSWNF